MQVVWLDEAKVLFKEAISFGFLAFGEKAVIRFVDEVQRTNERLSVFPRLGKIEPALRGLEREYRSLVVHKNYKVIYYIDDEQRYYMRSGHTCRRSHLTHKNQR